MDEDTQQEDQPMSGEASAILEPEQEVNVVIANREQQLQGMMSERKGDKSAEDEAGAEVRLEFTGNKDEETASANVRGEGGLKNVSVSVRKKSKGGEETEQSGVEKQMPQQKEESKENDGTSGGEISEEKEKTDGEEVENASKDGEGKNEKGEPSAQGKSEGGTQAEEGQEQDGEPDVESSTSPKQENKTGEEAKIQGASQDENSKPSGENTNRPLGGADDGKKSEKPQQESADGEASPPSRVPEKKQAENEGGGEDDEDEASGDGDHAQDGVSESGENNQRGGTDSSALSSALQEQQKNLGEDSKAKKAPSGESPSQDGQGENQESPDQTPGTSVLPQTEQTDPAYANRAAQLGGKQGGNAQGGDSDDQNDLQKGMEATAEEFAKEVFKKSGFWGMVGAWALEHKKAIMIVFGIIFICIIFLLVIAGIIYGCINDTPFWKQFAIAIKAVTEGAEAAVGKGIEECVKTMQGG